jgi:hypothetical protein
LLLAAGVAGEIVLEIFAWLIAPLLLGRPMSPSLLVSDLARSLFGLRLSMAASFTLRLASGIALFPVAYFLFRSAAKIQSSAMAGVVWGGILWFIAQALLAPLVGRPFMLGFGAYT